MTDDGTVSLKRKVAENWLVTEIVANREENSIPIIGFAQFGRRLRCGLMLLSAVIKVAEKVY